MEREDRKRINVKDRALQGPFLQRVQEKQRRVPSAQPDDTGREGRKRISVKDPVTPDPSRQQALEKQRRVQFAQ